MKDPFSLSNRSELVRYLQDCVALEKIGVTRPEIASRVVSIMSNDHWQEWYHDNEHPEFQELYEIASDIEAWPVYGLRESDWARFKELVNLLSKK